MSRLLISCGALTNGGAERVLSILSGSFADNFESVTYVMWVEAPVFYKIDPRVKIVSIEKEASSKNLLKRMIQFRKYIKSTCPDVILSFLTPFNMLVLTSLLGVNKKMIVAERNDPYQIPGGRFMAAIRNCLYRRATGILVQTHYAASYFKGSSARKTHVIYNPTFMDRSLVGSAASCSKEDIIVSVGRLHPQKDQKTLIKAFSIFKKQHPSYKLVIYGEGPSRAELESYIDALNLKKSVFLPGTTTDILDKMKTARVFVLSSLMEGMSNAMIEAMCLGIPVISTKVAGATELIADGENGFLVDQRDPDAIAERMAAITDDMPFAEHLSRNAVKLYDMLSRENIVPQWINYINGVLEKGV